jgi:hypothetical protein
MEGMEIAECQKVCNVIAREECLIKEGIVKEKVQEMVDGNMYLSEEEKSDFALMFCSNFDNYQILIKTLSRLSTLCLARDELTFILLKVVEFISSQY